MKPKKPEHLHIPKRWIGCPVEADYFGEDRKVGKMERKQALAKDRSKYKKTDRRKQEKQGKEIKFNREDLEEGRILSIASQGILVDANGELINCTLRGALKKEKTQDKNLVTVGDFVLFARSNGNEGLIFHIEPRRTVLSRAETLSQRKKQLLAANIDQVIITVSVLLPPLKPSLVDRYIIAAQKGGMEPLVVINKIDLLKDPDQDPELQAQEKVIYDEMLKAYQVAGVHVIAVSTLTGEGIEQLKHMMKDKASVFSGQSGVGKSSLINSVSGHSLRVGGLVGKTKKGTHTTTTAHLLPLDFGGWCIDTPGIKSFGVWDLRREELEQYYPEIFECGHQCKYPGCSHLHEEGCAVLRSLEDGEISRLRYESYTALMESITQNHFRR